VGQLEGQVAAVLNAGTPVGAAVVAALEAEDATVLTDDGRGVEALVDAVVEQHRQLDVFVLAPSGPPEAVALAETSDAVWSHELGRLDPLFRGLRRALPHMAARGSGRVVVVSSVEGKLARGGLAAYSAAQHAVCGLVKAAAQEVGTKGVMVNAVLAASSGEHSAIGRAVTPQDVAGAVALLASPAADGITGCMFPVDGGTLPY
jgi:3-hydroxybutyrate dehydrogenase